jgi:DNA-binding response OmpR family regulator
MPACNVLVVEDDPGISSIVTEFLRDEGLEVEAASDAEEALEIVQRESRLLILLDWMLPHDGEGVLHWLVADHHRKQHRVVVMTASMHAQFYQSQLEVGAIEAFLPKPFDLEALLSVVRQFAA